MSTNVAGAVVVVVGAVVVGAVVRVVVVAVVAVEVVVVGTGRGGGVALEAIVSGGAGATRVMVVGGAGVAGATEEGGTDAFEDSGLPQAEKPNATTPVATSVAQ